MTFPSWTHPYRPNAFNSFPTCQGLIGEDAIDGGSSLSSQSCLPFRCRISSTRARLTAWLRWTRTNRCVRTALEGFRGGEDPVAGVSIAGGPRYARPPLPGSSLGKAAGAQQAGGGSSATSGRAQARASLEIQDQLDPGVFFGVSLSKRPVLSSSSSSRTQMAPSGPSTTLRIRAPIS